MCFISISKCASLSNHFVNFALDVLFDLFLLINGFSCWWSVNNSIGFPYMYTRNCSSPYTTANSSSSFIEYFFSVSEKIHSRIQSVSNFRLSVFGIVSFPILSYLRLLLGCSRCLSCGILVLVYVLLVFRLLKHLRVFLCPVPFVLIFRQFSENICLRWEIFYKLR